MIGRRKVLGLLGIGTVSAPLAAKELMDADIASLAIRSDEQPPLSPAGPLSHMGMKVKRSSEEKDNLYTQALRFVSQHGVPEHIDAEIRDSTRLVYALDPDIACKRSWSMSVKIQEQRQRNYERRINEINDRNKYRKASEAFEKKFGFKWPWHYYYN